MFHYLLNQELILSVDENQLSKADSIFQEVTGKDPTKEKMITVTKKKWCFGYLKSKWLLANNVH